MAEESYREFMCKCLNRNITEMDVRRAFTSFQLMTILDKNHHSFLIVEHNSLLYENAGLM